MPEYLAPPALSIASDAQRLDAQSALFSRLVNGSLAGQQGFSLSGAATATAAGPVVNAAGNFVNQADYTLSPREFSTGVIRFQAQAGTNGNFMFVWGLPATGLPTGNFAVWSGAGTAGADLEFGWVTYNPGVTVTSAVKGIGVVPAGRYTVEIWHRGQTAGSVTEIRVWADGANRPVAPTISYTFLGTEPAIVGTRIGLRSISAGAVSYSNLEVIDNATALRNTLMPSGYWFPLVNAGRTVLATINQGARLDCAVQGSLNFTLNVVALAGAAYQPKVAFRVDGGPVIYRTPPTPGAQALSIALPDAGLHRVSIIAAGIHETDAVWTGAQGLLVSGVTVDAGGVVRRLTDDRPVLSVIGDSITAGIVAYGFAASGPVSQPSQSGGDSAYAQLTAQRLNYRVTQHGFGGTGIVVSGSGGVPKALTNVLNYQSTMPLFGEDVPALILVNEGTNDSAQSGGLMQSEYLAFVDALLARYPSARIVLMRPLNGAQAAVVGMVASLRGLQFVDTSAWSGVTFVDGTHPDLAGHSRIAELVYPTLSSPAALPPLTVRATLAFPVVAGQGQQELTVAVPGAALSDPVSVGAPATLEAGLVASGRVTAAGVATVRVSNYTAASVTPASASYAVSVLK